MASPNQQSITADPDLIRLGVGIAVVVAGMWVIDQVNPKLTTPYIIVVLLGVALTQRAGFEKFAAFLVAQTSGVNHA